MEQKRFGLNMGGQSNRLNEHSLLKNLCYVNKISNKEYM